MALKLLSGPLLEPVSLAEAKAHLRVDASDEDAFISSLVTTARLQIEAVLDLALITQQWQWIADCWPLNNVVELPMRPLQSIDAVRVRGADDVATVLDPISYSVDGASVPPRVASRSGFWPTPGARLNGIEIDFTAGFGAAAADVPADIRQALLLLAAYWFEHRDPTSAGATNAGVPDAVSTLLEPYKAVRL